MRGKSNIFYGIVLYALFMGFLVSIGYGISITHCSTLFADGYYSLTNDIFFNGGECINIQGVSFLVLDCNSHTISSSFGGNAIRIYNSSNVYLNDCVFKNTTITILVNKSQNISFANVMDFNSSASFDLFDSNSSILYNITLTGVRKGIYVEDSRETNISFSSLEGDGKGEGIIINNSYGVNISFNKVSGFVNASHIMNSSVVEILHNNISYNTQGVILENDDSIEVRDNILINNINLNNSGTSNAILSSQDCSKRSIVLSPCIGGNFWGDPTRNGFSDTCNDLNGDGFCDSSYSISGLVDSLPLARYIFLNLTVSPEKYDVNNSFNFMVEGTALEMPYLIPYEGNISFYLSSAGFVKNVSSYGGVVNGILYHKKDSYDKDLYAIVYGSGYVSNNSFPLKTSIFSLKVGIKGGAPIWGDYYYNFVYTSLATLNVLLFTPLKRSNITHILNSGTEIEISPIQHPIGIGIVGIRVSYDEIRERMPKYYSHEYCTFSFSHVINKQCDVVLPIYSPLEITSQFASIGEGVYDFILKRTSKGIFIGIK